MALDIRSFRSRSHCGCPPLTYLLDKRSGNTWESMYYERFCGVQSGYVFAGRVHVDIYPDIVTGY